MHLVLIAWERTLGNSCLIFSRIQPMRLSFAMFTLYPFAVTHMLSSISHASKSLNLRVVLGTDTVTKFSPVTCALKDITCPPFLVFRLPVD